MIRIAISLSLNFFVPGRFVILFEQTSKDFPKSNRAVSQIWVNLIWCHVMFETRVILGSDVPKYGSTKAHNSPKPPTHLTQRTILDSKSQFVTQKLSASCVDILVGSGGLRILESWCYLTHGSVRSENFLSKIKISRKPWQKLWNPL